MGLRADLWAVLWVLVFVGAIIGVDRLAKDAAELLATGTRVTAEVTDFEFGRKGKLKAIVVDFPAGGIRHRATIDADEDDGYHFGSAVQVIYDPADPTRVRTEQEANDGGLLSTTLIIAILVSLGGIPLSLMAAARWRRRYRAVAGTGWRRARVTVKPDYPIRKNRNLPDIEVTFREGGTMTLRAMPSTHGCTRLKNRKDRDAWIGGEGPDMVVLFTEGRWLARPHIVPAKDVGPQARRRRRRKAFES